MKTKTIPLRIVLLDADVIIDLHRHNIDLIQDEGKNFEEVSTTGGELLDFKSKFARFIEEELDPGETEALKILEGRSDCLFCSCDKVAIKVISIIGKREQSISFENLLKQSGIAKKLEPKHTEKYFKKYLYEGSILRIQRLAFKE